MLDIKLLTPDLWRTLRKIRLSALRESPDAFLSSYKKESEYDEPRWRTEFARGDWYVGIARVGSADEQVGISGITREDDTPADQCFLEYVWVAPEFRRQGIAFNMISEVLDRLKLSGVRTVFLWVLDGNDAAMRLYELLGFVRCNHRQPLKELPGRSEELMQLHLGLAWVGGGWDGRARAEPSQIPSVTKWSMVSWVWPSAPAAGSWWARLVKPPDRAAQANTSGSTGYWHE